MTVTVYSTTTCSTCHIVTEWLEQHGIAYVKKNTDEDAAAMADFMEVNDGMISVPLTVINAEDGTPPTKISGYDTTKFKAAFGL